VSPAASLTLACPGKLNLFLEILGRRPDGYHELATVMAPVDLADTLEVRRARGFSLEVEGARLEGTNTVEKAWSAVRRRRRIPGARARLVKRVPAGSGMGGGSSDAAAMIEALDRLYGLDLPRAEIAAEVGSDVAFFLQRGPALCTGRGERVSPLSGFPRFHAVLVWPGYSLSTAEVYRRAREFLTPRPRNVIDFLNSVARGGPSGLARRLFNRLEKPAFALRPELRALREALGRMPFRAVRMTGSGSALFGLCAGREDARALARRVRREAGVSAVPVSSVTWEESPWRSPKSASS
jgi:4-diphosphocytidyl-2-C-methyl-D-erythritol kinase